MLFSVHNCSFYAENNFELWALGKTVSYLGLIMIIVYAGLENNNLCSMITISCNRAFSQSNDF